MNKNKATATEIIRQSVNDIRNGQWVCGRLTCDIPQSKGQKPLGCAIGLLGMNSGAAKIGHRTYGGEVHVVASLEYPADPGADWTDESKKAVFILADSIPNKEWVENYNLDYEKDDLEDLERAQNMVIEYNDGACRTPKEAEKWFANALDKSMEVDESRRYTVATDA